MRTRIIPVAATSQSIAELLDIDISRVKGIALQAPVGNAANIYFGGSGNQDAFISPGGSTDVMPIGSTASLYVKGTVGDNIVIIVF